MPKHPKRHLGPLCPVMHFPVSPPECPPPGDCYTPKLTPGTGWNLKTVAVKHKNIPDLEIHFSVSAISFLEVHISKEITKETGKIDPLPKSFHAPKRMWSLNIKLPGGEIGIWIPYWTAILLQKLQFHRQKWQNLSHAKKRALLSIEYWLFNRDPCNGLIPV